MRYNDVCLSREFTKPRDLSVVCLYGEEHFKISYHLPSSLVIGTLVVEI